MGTRNKNFKFKLLILLGFIGLLTSIFNSSNEILIPSTIQSNTSAEKRNVKTKKNTFRKMKFLKKSSEQETEEIEHQEYNEIISCYPNVTGKNWGEVEKYLSSNYPKIFEQKINRHYESTGGKIYEYRLYIDREGNKDETLFERDL